MYIDLKAPDQPNLESVRQMLAAGDDSRNSQLRVTTSGIASIWNVSGYERMEGVLFYPDESYCAENGYVGEGAANDDEWVREICEGLRKMKRIFESLRTNGAKGEGVIAGAQMQRF